jgi:hypothetical protein
MSPRRLRLSVVFLVAALLALGAWHFHGPWWGWVVYGFLVGKLLTLAGRDHESEQP